jgi:DNA-binding GntR family transcriptional regulator
MPKPLANTALRRTKTQLEAIFQGRDTFERVVPGGNQAEMLNNTFHLAIAQASGNAFLEAGYKRLVAESLRLARVTLAFSSPDGITPLNHLERSVKEHREIAEAIANRDAERAEKLAQQHALLFRSRVDDFLQDNLSFDVLI